MIITIEVNIYYENLFFATITTTKSIKLIANNEKYTLISSTSVYLVILETDYS